MKRIPLAIVGLNFGRYVIEELLAPSVRSRFRIAALCDRDPGRAAEIGRRLEERGVRAAVHSDLEPILADPAIPAVGLFTPPEGRAALLRRLLRAGKDVMTTKPFEVDPAAAEAVLRETARRGRVVHLNSPSPLLPPDLEQVSRWRDRFDLGRPVGARAETWVSYREKADGSWYDDPERCPVAPIFRLGIYFINDLVRLFGPAREVQVQHSRIATGRPTPDTAQLGIRFRNDALASVFCSFAVDDPQPYRDAVTLNFERGTIFRSALPRRDAGMSGPAALLLTACARGREVVRQRQTSLRSGAYQWQAFHRAVLEGVPPGEAARREIVEGIRIVDAMRRAERTGTTQAV